MFVSALHTEAGCGLQSPNRKERFRLAEVEGGLGGEELNDAALPCGGGTEAQQAGELLCQHPRLQLPHYLPRHGRQRQITVPN